MEGGSGVGSVWRISGQKKQLACLEGETIVSSRAQDGMDQLEFGLGPPLYPVSNGRNGLDFLPQGPQPGVAVQQVRFKDQECGATDVPVEICPSHLVKQQRKHCLPFEHKRHSFIISKLNLVSYSEIIIKFEIILSL